MIRPSTDWGTAPLATIAPEVKGAVTAKRGVTYELWSVPSFAERRPEVIDGAEIGSTKRPVAPNDVLICKINPRINRVWKVRPTTRYPQIASPEWIIVRPEAADVVEPDYLRLYLSSPLFRDWIASEVSGVTGSHTRARPAQVLSQPIPYPPRNEQRRIVEILEGHLTRLDAAVASACLALQRAKALRQALWNREFGGLSAPVEPLLSVAAIANGQTPKGLADRLLPEPTRDSVPFYKVGDMNAADGKWMAAARFHAAKQDAQALGLHVRPVGTVLIPKRGGAIATNKKRILASAAAFDLNTMGLIPSDCLDSAYLWHWLSGVDLGRLADGSNVPQINAAQMRGLSLPVPALNDQLHRVKRLDQMDTSITRLASEGAATARRAEALRRSLLAAAFSGRLTGRTDDRDRADEMVGA